MHTLKVLLPPLICSWETALWHPDGVLRGSVDGTVVGVGLGGVCFSPLGRGSCGAAEALWHAVSQPCSSICRGSASLEEKLTERPKLFQDLTTLHITFPSSL